MALGDLYGRFSDQANMIFHKWRGGDKNDAAH